MNLSDMEEDFISILIDIGDDYIENCEFSTKSDREMEFEQFYVFSKRWFEEKRNRGMIR